MMKNLVSISIICSFLFISCNPGKTARELLVEKTPSIEKRQEQLFSFGKIAQTTTVGNISLDDYSKLSSALIYSEKDDTLGTISFINLKEIADIDFYYDRPAAQHITIVNRSIDIMISILEEARYAPVVLNKPAIGSFVEEEIMQIESLKYLGIIRSDSLIAPKISTDGESFTPGAGQTSVFIFSIEKNKLIDSFSVLVTSDENVMVDKYDENASLMSDLNQNARNQFLSIFSKKGGVFIDFK